MFIEISPSMYMPIHISDRNSLMSTTPMRTYLSSCCQLKLEAWESTWRPPMWSSYTTLTSILTMTSRQRTAVTGSDKPGMSACMLVWNICDIFIRFELHALDLMKNFLSLTALLSVGMVSEFFSSSVFTTIFFCYISLASEFCVKCGYQGWE